MPPKKVTQPKKEVKDVDIEINMDNVADWDENQLRNALQSKEQCDFAFNRLNEIFVGCEDEMQLINIRRTHIVDLLRILYTINKKFDNNIDYTTSDFSNEPIETKAGKKSEDEDDDTKTKPKKPAAKKTGAKKVEEPADQSHSLEEPVKKPVTKKTNKKPAEDEPVDDDEGEPAKKPVVKKPTAKKVGEDEEPVEEPVKKVITKKVTTKKPQTQADESPEEQAVSEEPVVEKPTTKKPVVKKTGETVSEEPKKVGPKKTETGVQKKVTNKK